MGNNPITTAGAIALVSAINENDSSVLAFLDLTVSFQQITQGTQTLHSEASGKFKTTKILYGASGGISYPPPV